VRLELQADCYAGVGVIGTAAWRSRTGDVEEGLGAASAVGDDRIQEMSGRAVNPDAFTHGSAEQRMEWFTRGLKSGTMRDCETFR
jgi:predicted metalloprotease